MITAEIVRMIFSPFLVWYCAFQRVGVYRTLRTNLWNSKSKLYIMDMIPREQVTQRMSNLELSDRDNTGRRPPKFDEGDEEVDAETEEEKKLPYYACV